LQITAFAYEESVAYYTYLKALCGWPKTSVGFVKRNIGDASLSMQHNQVGNELHLGD
jgi:hypothetical protein